MAEPRPTVHLPHVAYNYFFYAFSAGGKRLFVLYYVLLVGVLGALVYFSANPDAHLLTYASQGEVYSSLEVVERTTVDARTVDLRFPVLYSFPSYLAYAKLTPAWLIWGFLVVQALAWAGLLAGAARLKGAGSYVVYGLFAVAFYFGDYPHGWVADRGTSLLVAFGLVMAFLGPAYLFKQKIWSRSLPTQVLLYVVLFALIYLGVYSSGGLPGLHRVATKPLMVLLIPAIIYLIHISKDGINLILLAATNHAERRHRLPAPAIVVLLGLWLIVTTYFFWAMQENWLRLPGWAPRPMYLLVLCSLVTVFTSQNYFHQAREYIGSNLAFSLLNMSTGLLAIGSLLYLLASGERLVVYQLEKLFSLFLALMSLLYTGYLLGHFWPYLKARLNLYYVVMEPPVPSAVRFVALWFIVVSGAVLVEGLNSWPTPSLAFQAQLSAQGDNYRLRDDHSQAQVTYQFAAQLIPTNPKVNFLLANYLSEDKSVGARDVLAAYQLVEDFLPYPAGRLNHAHFALGTLGKEGALKALLRNDIQWPDARALHNAAELQRQLQKPGAAMGLQIRAVALAPRQAYLKSTLALQYHTYNQPEQALAFAQQAAALRPTEPVVLQQLAFLEIALGSDQLAEPLLPNPFTIGDAGPLGLLPDQRFTLGLAAYRQHNQPLLDTLCREGLKLQGAGEFNLLAMLMDLGADSLANALSRHLAISADDSAFGGLTAQIMGYGFFKNHLPEAAAPLYATAARNGWPADTILVAQMQADAGRLSSAMLLLAEATRSAKPELAHRARRELALCYLALNQDSLAGQIWNTQQASTAQLLQAGRIAMLAGYPRNAYLLANTALRRDSLAYQPYVLIAEAYHDSLPDEALTVLSIGQRQYQPGTEGYEAILLAQARLAVDYPTEQGLAFVDSLFKSSAARTESRAGNLLYLDMLLAQNDTAAARQRAETWLLAHPADIEAELRRSEVYYRAGQYHVALDIIEPWLNLLPTHTGLWIAYARHTEALTFTDRARYGAQQAILHSKSEAERQALQKQFSALLALPIPESLPANSPRSSE